MPVYCANSNELYHHGIKGQKWGVRRFQKKDGSLTPAGRKRYDDDGPSQKKQKEYKMPKNKSLHRLKIEEKYKAQGMSEKEAEQAAAKRIRAEQYVAGAAAVTVAAAVAYSKYKNYNVDKVLSSNTEFHRILSTDNPDAPVRKGPRYVAYNKNDRMKYRGIYGRELKLKEMGNFDPNAPKKNVYDMTIKSKDKIRVASEKRARETFENLYKNDPEFRKNIAIRAEANRVPLMMKKGMMKGDVVDKLIKEGDGLTDKQLKSKAYDLFNIMLVDSDERSRSNQNKFYNALKEQGMNAVKDMNDKKYSGYNTKNPLILFDGDFEYSNKELTYAQIDKDLKKSMGQLIGGKVVATGAAYAAAFSASPIIDNRTVEKQVIEYKREHPETKMSDAELKKMFKKQIKDQYKQ